MVGITYPPVPLSQVIVRNGNGDSWVEDVFDRPPAFDLPTRQRRRPTANLVAVYCCEQVAHDMLPFFDLDSARKSHTAQRKVARELLPAILYRLRIEGYRYGKREMMVTSFVLDDLAATPRNAADIISAVSDAGARLWWARRNDKPLVTFQGDIHGLPPGLPPPPAPRIIRR